MQTISLSDALKGIKRESRTTCAATIGILSDGPMSCADFPNQAIACAAFVLVGKGIAEYIPGLDGFNLCQLRYHVN